MTGPGERIPSPGRPSGGREPLSEEEIRGLLGEDYGNGSEADSGGAGLRDPGSTGTGLRKVLVVTKDDDEVRMVRGVLGGLGIEVAAVRNTFVAIDHLRRQEHAGVISDFEVWADGGGLLFHRLAESGARAPVVFICSSDEGARRARESAACEVLRRPFQPGDLARAARAFGSMPEDGERLEPFPAGARQVGGRVEGRVGAISGPISGAISGAVSAAGQPAASGEVAWLRFFFEARQAMRSLEPGWDRLAAILETYRRVIDAGGCGVGILLEGGWWARVHPGSPGLHARLGAALAKRGPDPDAPEGRPPGAPVWWIAGGRPAVFVSGLVSGLASGCVPGLEVPEKFLSELSLLLAEAGSPRP